MGRKTDSVTWDTKHNQSWKWYLRLGRKTALISLIIRQKTSSQGYIWSLHTIPQYRGYHRSCGNINQLSTNSNVQSHSRPRNGCFRKAEKHQGPHYQTLAWQSVFSKPAPTGNVTFVPTHTISSFRSTKHECKIFEKLSCKLKKCGVSYHLWVCGKQYVGETEDKLNMSVYNPRSSIGTNKMD